LGTERTLAASGATPLWEWIGEGPVKSQDVV
jgi:hypothetical protein